MKRRNFLAMLIGLPVVGKWFKPAPTVSGSWEYVSATIADNALLDPGDTFTWEAWVDMPIRADLTHVKFFNHALTEDQVRTHYATPPIRVTSSGSVTHCRADSGPPAL